MEDRQEMDNNCTNEGKQNNVTKGKTVGLIFLGTLIAFYILRSLLRDTGEERDMT